MRLIIEVIDGVAYAVIKERERTTCKKCAFNFVPCRAKCSKYGKVHYYRRLTQEEREELIKAIGRGME